MRKLNKNGVSPVMATIIMLSLTIVLIGVLWLYINSCMQIGKPNVDFTSFNNYYTNTTIINPPDNITNNTVYNNNTIIYDNPPPPDNELAIVIPPYNNITTVIYNNTTIVYNNTPIVNNTTVVNNYTNTTIIVEDDMSDVGICFKNIKVLMIKLEYKKYKHEYIDINMIFKQVKNWQNMNHIKIGNLHIFWHGKNHKFIYIYYGKLPCEE
jgi:flagellin-like protein